MTEPKKNQIQTSPSAIPRPKTKICVGGGNLLCQAIEALPDDTVFVDLFGGSGLLSRTAKDLKPNCRVIYNDFDNYTQRLQNIERTNALLREIRTALADVPKGKIAPPERKAEVLAIVERYERDGFVDYITISSAILFSMNYVTDFAGLSKATFYNNVRLDDYPPAADYLQGLEIWRCDYRQLFDEFKDNPNTFFFCDPPYLSTDATTYAGFWTLHDYLDVMNCLQGTRFAFFTSNKSSLVELLEWFEQNYGYQTPFSKTQKIEIKTSVNYSSKYTDMAILKTS